MLVVLYKGMFKSFVFILSLFCGFGFEIELQTRGMQRGLDAVYPDVGFILWNKELKLTEAGNFSKSALFRGIYQHILESEPLH